MGKGRQFKYVEQRRSSFKPVKATRLRGKKEEDNILSKPEVVSAGLYVLSFLCLVIAVAILL